LLHPVVFQLYTNISEEHTVSFFRAEVRRVRNWMAHTGQFLIAAINIRIMFYS
jgi:hypothetical protein